MNYIKKENKRLLKSGWRVMTLFAGVFLVLQHYLVWGRLDFLDFLGHETLGVLLIILGLVSMTKFKWTNDLNPFEYAWEKIKYTFKLKGG